MGFIAAGIAAVLGSAAATVGGIAGGITATISAAAGSIVTTVGGIVSSITTTLGTTLGSVIEGVGGIAEGVSGTIEAALETIRTGIAEPFGEVVQSLKAGIGEIAKAITEPVKPILDPIRETLVDLHGFMADTQAWIQTELKPVADLVDFVNDISAILVVKRLLEGTTDIAEIIGDVEGESGAATAQAIAVLYRDMAAITTDTLDTLRGHYTRLNETIEGIGDRIRQENKVALAYVEETLKGELRELTDPLYERVGPLERELAYIERRTMDLPFFQEMLIRSIE